MAQPRELTIGELTGQIGDLRGTIGSVGKIQPGPKGEAMSEQEALDLVNGWTPAEKMLVYHLLSLKLVEVYSQASEFAKKVKL